jgi:hypothetical protein
VSMLARRGLDEYILRDIERANEAAMNAGLPLPDFSRVMRECLENKRNLVINKVRTQNGVARSSEQKSSCNGG